MLCLPFRDELALHNVSSLLCHIDMCVTSIIVICLYLVALLTAGLHNFDFCAFRCELCFGYCVHWSCLEIGLVSCSYSNHWLTVWTSSLFVTELAIDKMNSIILATD